MKAGTGLDRQIAIEVMGYSVRKLSELGPDKAVLRDADTTEVWTDESGAFISLPGFSTMPEQAKKVIDELMSQGIVISGNDPLGICLAALKAVGK